MCFINSTTILTFFFRRIIRYGPSNEIWVMSNSSSFLFSYTNFFSISLLKAGQPVVAVQGWKGGLGHTNTLRVIYSPSK
jgi:hypothetical protein